MTSDAPRDFTHTTLSEPQVPMTSAPAHRASCTTQVPTPPEAAVTNTLFPLAPAPASGLSPAFTNKACHAVSADIGTVADSAHVSRFGLRASSSVGAVAYSWAVPV